MGTTIASSNVRREPRAASGTSGSTAGLGGRFAAEVERAIEQLLQHPKIGVPDEDGFRKWVLATFPSNLRYSETDDLVYILVVESQHRRPGYWKSRLAR